MASVMNYGRLVYFKIGIPVVIQRHVSVLAHAISNCHALCHFEWTRLTIHATNEDINELAEALANLTELEFLGLELVYRRNTARLNEEYINYYDEEEDIESDEDKRHWENE